jgi:hypothetical protein
LDFSKLTAFHAKAGRTAAPLHVDRTSNRDGTAVHAGSRASIKRAIGHNGLVVIAEREDCSSAARVGGVIEYDIANSETCRALLDMSPACILRTVFAQGGGQKNGQEHRRGWRRVGQCRRKPSDASLGERYDHYASITRKLEYDYSVIELESMWFTWEAGHIFPNQSGISGGISEINRSDLLTKL